MKNEIELSWLLPDLSQLKLLPETGLELSSLFVVVLWTITLIASLFFLYKYFRASSRVTWLYNILKDLKREDVASKRVDLLQEAKKRDKDIGFLWMEFDETLVEVLNGHNIEIRNTLDAGHFFNSYTLASSVAENRLVAAVPGFLTALGVIGTFIGLQLGLGQLELGSGVDVSTMQNGVAGVVDGAKVAFLTSVWGVALSVLFNFGEKAFEQKLRSKIRKIEYTVDWLFPRIRPEEQLQNISENSSESRDVLQGLAEQIGVKMQEAMLTATQGIQQSLESSLNEIMAPAINKLVDETSEGNQKALEGLLESFMEGFGSVGEEQRQSLDSVSSKVNSSVEAMQATMNSFVENLKQTQVESGEREKALLADISNQVNSLTSKSEEIHNKLTSFVGNQVESMSSQLKAREDASAMRDQELVANIKIQVDELVQNSRIQSETLSNFVKTQLGGLVDSFNKRDQITSELETERNEKIESQSQAITNLSSELLSSVEKSVAEQVQVSNRLIAQGEALQNSVNASLEESSKAAQAMNQSSTEMKLSADSMKVLSSHVKDASNILSGAISSAVESTADLANQNQQSSERMEELRNGLLEDVSMFGNLTTQLNELMATASSSFSELKSSQKEFIGELKNEVEDLSKKMTQLLGDYAEQANGQTAEHLSVWSKSVTDYNVQMNNAVKALSSVVDEMQVKLG
jgi:hypothetical protein